MSVQILASLHNVVITLLSLELENRHHCHQERNGRQGRDIEENRRETVWKQKARSVEVG